MRLRPSNALHRICLALLLGLSPLPVAHAGDIIMAFDSGAARFTDRRYESAFATRFTGGYAWGNLTVAGSFHVINDFQLKADKGAKQVLRSVSSAQAYWTTDWRSNKLDFGGGLVGWNLEAKYNRSIYGEEEGISPMIEARLRKSFNSVYGMFVSTRYIHDIEREGLFSLSLGVWLSF